jgi:hypothetical protein
MEYKLAWQYFINCDLKKMLILNFDLADYEKFQYKKTRALNRFNMTFLISTNKTDRHDITEILLRVALSTINLNQT